MAPFLFRNYEVPADHALPRTTASSVLQAGSASGAAKPYLLPVVVGDRTLLDGGFYANPTVVALVHEAAVAFPGRPIELVLSLGTGHFPLKPMKDPCGRLGQDDGRPRGKQRGHCETRAATASRHVSLHNLPGSMSRWQKRVPRRCKPWSERSLPESREKSGTRCWQGCG